MKNAKRIVAIVLTFAMVMALGITAFAEQIYQSNPALNYGDGKIVVTGGEELKDKTVVAVRMWNIADLGENDNKDSVLDANEVPDYDIVNDWIYSGAGWGNSFFYYNNYGQTFGGSVTENPLDTQINVPANRTKDRLLSLDPDNNPDDAKLLAEFANEARLYYQDHENGFDKEGDGQVVYTAKTEPNGDGTYTATIDNAPTGLPYGYYLVFVEGSASGAMLVNVPSYEAEHLNADIKVSLPTVDKKANGLDEASAKVGDVVEFTLESTVPNLSGYETFKFIFKDTISSGLEFVANSLVVEIKNDSNSDYSKVIGTDDESKAYEINDYAAEGNKYLEVNFADLTKVNVAGVDIKEGAVIRVTYKAVITDDALTSGESVNEATITYSNDPTDETGNTTGTSTPDVVTVYNYSLEIHKFHTNDENEANRLEGAHFKLKDASGSYMNLVLIEQGGNAYRVATKNDSGVWEDGSVDEIVTPKNGVLVIRGLEAGTYFLEETVAPEGYNKLKSDLEITIDTTAGYDKDEVVYSVNGAANEDPHSNVIGVKNSNGTLLPSTGGIGTIIITVVGVAVVIGGFVLLRKKDDEDTAVKA